MDAIISKPMGIDVLSSLQQWQALRQAQLNASLTGQQIQGAALQNQLAGLGIGQKAYGLNLLGVPTGGATVPPPSPLSAVAAGPASASSVQPQPGGPALPPAQQDAGSGGDAAASGNGIVFQGIPMPKAALGGLALSGFTPDAVAKINETRRQTIFQTVSSTPPNDYPAAMAQLAQAGWVSPPQLQDALAHPEGRARILQATITPEAYQSAQTAAQGQGIQYNPQTGQPMVSGTAVAAKGALATQEATAKAAVTPTTITQPGPNGQPQQVNTNALAASQAGDAPGGSAPALNVGMQAVNSITNPAAQSMALKAAVAAGLPPEALPAWISTIHNESGWNLSAANGAAGEIGPGQIKPATGQTLGYTAQQLADPQTNLIASARYFAQQWAASHGQPAQSMAGYNTGDVTKPDDAYTGPAMARLNGWSGAAQPGAIPGTPTGINPLGPTGQVGLDVTKQAITSDQGEVAGSLAKAQGAQQAQAQLLNLRSLGGQINAGSFADARQGMQNYLATFAPQAAQDFTKAVTGGLVDPSKAGATQEFVKLSLQNAGSAERDTLGSRGGYGAIQLYQKSFPNIETQPSAIHDMTNLLLVAHQRDIDYGQGVNQYFQSQRDGFEGGSGAYNSTQKYDQQFMQSNSPQVYVGAAAALNDVPYTKWSQGLNPAQHQEALRVMWRADPSATPLGADGKTRYSNPALAAASQ